MKESLLLRGSFVPQTGEVYLKIPYTTLHITAIDPEAFQAMEPLLKSKCPGCPVFKNGCEGVSGVRSDGTILTDDNKRVVDQGENCNLATSGNFAVPKDGIIVQGSTLLFPSQA